MSATGSYNKTNETMRKIPFLIGVAGGTASGKTSVCKKIMEKLGQEEVDRTERKVVTMTQDSFYKALESEGMPKSSSGKFNFDHPDAFNDLLMYETLRDILSGTVVHVPLYDYHINSIIPGKTVTVYRADVVLFEGILVFYYPEIRHLFDMKLFVDADSDTRLSRRIVRDIKVRGRDLDHVLSHYMDLVKPAFEEFCLPTKKYADVIIPRGAENIVAIDLIVQHIQNILSHRKESK